MCLIFSIGTALLSYGGYLWGRYSGYIEGISRRKSWVIASSKNLKNHCCNVLSHNMVCFEHDNELWVKEYHDGEDKLPEGRTYKVNYCPWCGHQTEKQKSQK
jgi:hypothetical protein